MEDETKPSSPEEGQTTSSHQDTVETDPKQAAEEKKQQRAKSRPVKVYMTVLFVVVIFLLLLSFAMQQRNHSALQDLNDSISSSQDVSALQLENQRLEYELEQKAELETQLETAQKQVEALEWLRQIEEAVGDSDSAAKNLVEEFEETELPAYLPKTSAIEGAQSPADAYKAIYAMLF